MTTKPERLPRRLGAYELVERVGEGGMGVVYRAIDKRLGTSAAVKVIHEHLRNEPGYLERFRREAHVASLLTSPYIVHVIEFGYDKDAYYLATEYVTGTRLAEVMEKGPIEPEQALSVAVQVTLALAEADVRGVIHRDIKPENIILTTDGSVKLMDFGIARLSYSRGVTEPGLFVGTVAYSAPEQFRGQADIRSDMYSLGVVLFQMLAGDMPFQASTIGEMIAKHAQEPPPMSRLAHLPQPIVDVVARCLEKSPAARFQRPSELLTALEQARDSIPAARAGDWVMNATIALGSQHMPEGGATQQVSTVIAGQVRGGYTAPVATPAPAAQRKGQPVLLYAGAAAVAAIILFGGYLLAAGGGDNSSGLAITEPTAEATPTEEPAAVAPPAEAPPPDRTNCDEIRGTPFHSATEEAWFNANCTAPPPAAVAPTRAPTGGSSQPAVSQPPAAAPPAVVVQPPVSQAPSGGGSQPAPAATYSIYGFSDSATTSFDPPPSTVSSGGRIPSCGPQRLYAWVDYANAPVPVTYTGRWYRNDALINETSFNQTVANGRMFWQVGSPLPAGVYRFEVYQGELTSRQRHSERRLLMAERLNFELAAVTDKGVVRPENQDSVYAGQIGEGRYLAAVADGVGGREGGAWASSRALEVLRSAIAHPGISLSAAVAEANQVVFTEAASKTELHGAATTLVSVLVEGGSFSWANVGDSRAYLLRGANFDQLTTDHSLVEEELAAGRITREQAANASYRNVITRSIGHRPAIEIDSDGPLPLAAGDILLLCSDGLHGLVSSEEMERRLRELPPSAAAASLLELANQRGGHDNISVVIVRAQSAVPEAGQETTRLSPNKASQGSTATVQLPRQDGGLPSFGFVAFCLAAGALAGFLLGLRPF